MSININNKFSQRWKAFGSVIEKNNLYRDNLLGTTYKKLNIMLNNKTSNRNYDIINVIIRKLEILQINSRRLFVDSSYTKNIIYKVMAL